MVEASPVYFQCVNEWAAHLKMDSFRLPGSMNENQKALGV